jgi:glucose-6-phosphate isomerase
MQDYTLTVISKTGHTQEIVVQAESLDAAVNKMLDKISYDVREIHADDVLIIL